MAADGGDGSVEDNGYWLSSRLQNNQIRLLSAPITVKRPITGWTQRDRKREEGGTRELIIPVERR